MQCKYCKKEIIKGKKFLVIVLNTKDAKTETITCLKCSVARHGISEFYLESVAKSKKIEEFSSSSIDGTPIHYFKIELQLPSTVNK